MNVKNLLIISYYWPPAGGPGVQRVLKFVKYLQDFAWQPVILTVKDGDYPALDPSLVHEIPANTKVYKIPIWEPYNIYRRILGKNKSEPIPVAVLTQKENMSFKTRLLHWIRANFFIPDARIGWFYSATREAEKIINEHNIKLVLISSPPHSLQLIGRKLKKSAGIPVISDFRDPWTDIHYYHNLKRSVITRYIDKYLEKSVFEYSDLIITVSPDLKRLFESKSAKVNCEVVFNGFDKADFNIKNKQDKSKFVLAYVGNFKANQDIQVLWKVLSELIKSRPDFAKDFLLEFTGKLNSDTLSNIKKFQLENHTQINDYTPHYDAIKKMISAASLLFIIPVAENNKGILTGKIFDYLASGTPVFAIGPPDGDAAQILSETNAGKMIEYGNEMEMKKNLIKLYDAWSKGESDKYRPDADSVDNYERRKMTSKLAEHMNNILQENMNAV